MSRLVASVTVLAAAIMTTTPAGAAPARPPALLVHHLQVSVADADALATWYVAKLGFKVTKRAKVTRRVDGGIVKVVWIDIPGFRVGLAQVPGSTRPAEMNAVPPNDAMHQGYRQIHYSTPNVDAAYRSLSANGVRFVTPPTSFSRPGIRLATFADPEGNLISLYQDLDPANALLPARK